MTVDAWQFNCQVQYTFDQLQFARSNERALIRLYRLVVVLVLSKILILTNSVKGVSILNWWVFLFFKRNVEKRTLRIVVRFIYYKLDVDKTKTNHYVGFCSVVLKTKKKTKKLNNNNRKRTYGTHVYNKSIFDENDFGLSNLFCTTKNNNQTKNVYINCFYDVKLWSDFQVFSPT